VRAARQPTEHILGADDGQRPGLEGAVQGREHGNAAGFHQTRALAHELGDVGHVLDYLETGDDVERRAFGGEVFDARGAIVDGEALRLGVALGNGDVAF